MWYYLINEWDKPKTPIYIRTSHSQSNSIMNFAGIFVGTILLLACHGTMEEEHIDAFENDNLNLKVLENGASTLIGLFVLLNEYFRWTRGG